MKALDETHVRFDGEGFLNGSSASFDVRKDNRGEPYRTGIAVGIEMGGLFSGVFLEDYEARKLRDLLNRLYPEPKP